MGKWEAERFKGGPGPRTTTEGLVNYITTSAGLSPSGA